MHLTRQVANGGLANSGMSALAAALRLNRREAGRHGRDAAQAPQEACMSKAKRNSNTVRWLP